VHRLLAVLVLAGASVNAQTYTSGDWQYSVSGGEATIRGYLGTSNSIVFPSTIDGNPVKTIGSGNNVSGLSSVTSITIPEGVTSIGSNAFENRSALTSVNIPSTISLIGGAAFAFTGLQSIDLSNTTANVGESIFYACSALTSVKLPLNIGVVHGWMFYGCSSLSEVIIPAGVYSIANGAFANCSSLTKIYFLGNQPVSVPMASSFQNSPVTLYVLPTSTGWGASFAGRPVVSVSSTEILTTPNKFQLFSSAQMNSNRIAGRSDVTSNPSTYGLYTPSQYNANFTTGQMSVLGNPNAHELYSTNQINTMAFGGLTLRRDYSGQFFLSYVIEKSDDLQSWSTYQEYDLPITNLPTSKAFLRILPWQASTGALLRQKIVGAIAEVNRITSGSVSYYQRYNNWTADGGKPAIIGYSSEPYTRSYGDGATVSQGTTTFGDLLLAEGFIDMLRLPIGANGYPNASTYTPTSISLSQESSARTTPVNAGGINYPLVVCRIAASGVFTSSAYATRLIFILIPGLSLAEAAMLKNEFDGPFPGSPSDSELVTKAVLGNATGSNAIIINKGNCRLTPSPLPGGVYDAWCYIAND